MILEVAVLNVISGKEEEFEAAFHKASQIIASMTGYISHQLQRCIENQNQYVLLVKWATLEDHTHGFRDSAEYQEWRALLHNFLIRFQPSNITHWLWRMGKFFTNTQWPISLHDQTACTGAIWTRTGQLQAGNIKTERRHQG